MPGVAIVTGAAQGIGEAIAFQLSADGYKIALVDLASQKERLEEVCKRLSTDPQNASRIYFCDVSKELEVERMVEEVVNTLGELKVMIANAGIMKSVPRDISNASTDEFTETISVNLMGTVFCYKYASKQMIKQGSGGRIVGASSFAGVHGIPYFSPYVASKFAIRGITESAALELAPHGITVNCYAPGGIDTEMTKAMPGSENAKDRIATGRLGKPEEVAALVSYLVSEKAVYVTGQTIRIDGGLMG